MEQAHPGLLKVSLMMGHFHVLTFLEDDGAGMGGEALKRHTIQLLHYNQSFPQPQMQEVFVELREIGVE
jgi:hypothetical protein